MKHKAASAQRFFGGILLVSGTAIGAGMLALPVISSFGGFFPSWIILFLCWGFLYSTSLLLLDVNLACPGEANLTSMANRTLGTGGKFLCWITYLLLLYSLTAAYIAGISPLFVQALQGLTGWQVPDWVGPFPLLLLFGVFVYLGTETVDRVNRILMGGLILSYLFLVAMIPGNEGQGDLLHVDWKAMWIAVPVVITSYGFHIIIPTLTTYLEHDRKKLRWTLLIGSLIPFLIYTIWNFLILGAVPIEGETSLVCAWEKGQTAAYVLAQRMPTSWAAPAALCFSFFAILTSFLGVSLSLSDFLTDGFRMKRLSLGRELATLCTFIPPLIFVLCYPRGFLLALQYAGIFVVILLCILPAWMASKLPSYRTRRKRLFLGAVILLSLFVIGLDILEHLGILKEYLSSYVQIKS